MNKYIKVFLLLVFTCIACFLIHDNVYASNSLDDLTDVNNNFEYHPYQQFVDSKVAYCHDHGTYICSAYFKTDSTERIDYKFYDFYNKLIKDMALSKTFFVVNKTNLDTSSPNEFYNIYFSSEDMYLKKEVYQESRPEPFYKGNTYQFLYEDGSNEHYYVLSKIGNNLFSFDVYSKDTYSLKYDIRYSVSTNEQASDVFLIYSNYKISDFEGNILFDETDYKFDLEAPQKSIFDVIKGILTTIVELPFKLVKALIEGIIELVNGLFVPEKDFFSNWFNDMKSLFEQKLGFLSYSFTFILDLLNRFLSLEDTKSYVISWPEIKVPIYDVSIINSGSFSLNELLNNAAFNTLYDLYILVTDALMIIAFINLCKKTYDKAFGGGV